MQAILIYIYSNIYFSQNPQTIKNDLKIAGIIVNTYALKLNSNFNLQFYRNENGGVFIHAFANLNILDSCTYKTKTITNF